LGDQYKKNQRSGYNGSDEMVEFASEHVSSCRMVQIGSQNGYSGLDRHFLAEKRKEKAGPGYVRYLF
jgi:hypothetical protein